MKGVYEATRRLCNEGPRNVGVVKNEEGTLLTKEGEIKTRWQEYLTEVLNRPVPKVATEVEETDVVNNSKNIGEITGAGGGVGGWGRDHERIEGSEKWKGTRYLQHHSRPSEG